MAFVRPSLVVDTTATSGVGTYTLDDPAAPGGGFRTLADAVADGDVSAGDTISYFVVDTTTQAATLQWEHGTGTVGAGGLTLARTFVIESSNSDLAVSWGSGGSRTVRFGAGTAGFALLAATNTFTAAQIFSAGLSSADAVTIAKSVAAAGFNGLTVSNTAAANVANIAAAAFQVLDAGSTARSALSIQARLETLTAGNDSSFVNFQARSGGAAVNVFRITGGQLTDGSSVPYAKTGVLSAPAGTKMIFKQATPPTGWTKDTADNDAALRVVSGTPGASGGSRGLSAATVGGTAITTAQLAAHTHDVPKSDFVVDAGTTATVLRTDITTGNYATTSTGSDATHDHALALKYVDVIIASKT